MKVFVTGGTGLLGGSIITELLNRNHTVTALVRSVKRAEGIIAPSVRLVEGNLEECDEFATALAGQEALIHAAACYGEYYRIGREKALRQVNVQGTTSLLETANRQGLRNIVYISSAAVLESVSDQEVDEGSPYATDGEPYFQSKIESEREVYRFLDAHPEFRIIFMLPTVMLGPGDRGPTPNGKFVLTFLQGGYKFIIPGSNRIVDVRDVARAAVETLTVGKSGERYLLGGRMYPYADIFRILSQVTGVAELKKTISPRKLMLLARLMTIIHAIRGKPSPLKPEIVRRLQKNFRYNSSKAEMNLGVTFRPLSETLADTVMWFRTNGYA